MEKAIITSEAVDKTFEGKDCLLKRSIVSSFKENGEKRYIIRTERCNYVDKEQQVFDEDNQPVLDENNNRTFETVKVLKVINKKDDDFVEKLDYKKIDDLYQSIKSQVNLEDGYMNFEERCEQLALLHMTKEAQAWGINPDKWQLFIPNN